MRVGTTEVEAIRLPCGHTIERPKGAAHIICESDGRKWFVYTKNNESIAQEE